MKSEHQLQPARGCSWPPFEEGNTAALQHGGYSESDITERAAEVMHRLLENAPWLNDEPVYVIPVARFVRVEARSQLLGEAICSKRRRRKTSCALAHGSWKQRQRPTDSRHVSETTWVYRHLARHA